MSFDHAQSQNKEQQLLAEMEQEGRDAIEDLLERLNEVLPRTGQSAEALAQFLKDVHSLKGIGAAFGFQGLSTIAHALEDFMEGAGGFGPETRSDIQDYLDAMARLVERGAEIGADQSETGVAELLRRLPGHQASRTFDPALIEVSEVHVLLVAPKGAASRYVAKELQECGYSLSCVSDPIDTIERAIRDKPDLVIVTAVLERMSGVDLVCALRAMPSTRGLGVALLTSLASNDSALAGLPAGVPVLGKGAGFSDDVAEALSTLGVT